MADYLSRNPTAKKFQILQIHHEMNDQRNTLFQKRQLNLAESTSNPCLERIKKSTEREGASGTQEAAAASKSN